MDESAPQFLDEPPQGLDLTTYDREHMVLYLRLFDAHREGADWREAVRVIFGIDPAVECERARLVYDSHLARARWMTESGYRHYLRSSS